MREPWRSFLYVALVGSLPLAFWYALWPLRRRLNPPAPRAPAPPPLSSEG